MAVEPFDRHRVVPELKGKGLSYKTKNGIWSMWCSIMEDNTVYGQIQRIYRVSDGGISSIKLESKTMHHSAFWSKDEPGSGAIFVHDKKEPSQYVLDIAHQLVELARPIDPNFDWDKWACEAKGAGLLTEDGQPRNFHMEVKALDVIKVCVIDPTIPYTLADLQTLADDEDLIIKVCHEFREYVYHQGTEFLNKFIHEILNRRDELKDEIDRVHERK